VELGPAEGTSTALPLELIVRRSLNSLHVTMLGVLLSISLTVALGLSGMSPIGRVAFGVGTLVGLAILFRVLFKFPRSRDIVIRIAEWVVGD
jgi:hypothetical protein